MSATARAIVATLLFAPIFLSGIWLSRRGRPLNVGISTVHKLISLIVPVLTLLSSGATLYLMLGAI